MQLDSCQFFIYPLFDLIYSYTI